MFKAAVAVAAHAAGHGGTGHDLWITRALGHNISAAMSDAKERMRRKPHAVRAVAVELERKKTLSGNEVERVIWEADRKEEVDDVIVSLTNPDGTELDFETTVKKNKDIVVPIELFRAPSIEDGLADVAA